LPDATPTSIDPPSPDRRDSSARRGLLRIAVYVLITAVVLAFIARAVAPLWKQFRTTPLEAHPRWGMIVLASLVVLAAYGVLIETWRRMVFAWDGNERLSFDGAARIWSLSSLARYLPGNTFIQVGALAALARQQQVSATAAAGSAAINTIVAIAAGFVVACAAGWRALSAAANGWATLELVLVAALFALLLSLPALMPRALAVARRVTGRPLDVGTLPRRGVYASIAGNVIAWCLYGIAFQLFVIGVLGRAPGSTLDFIAVYSSAYVVGYLAFWLPAGIGVRDTTQAGGLVLLGLATGPQAAVVAICARLWITLLELLPALFYLARSTRRRASVSPAPPSRDGTNR
jgi:hypothetical protein